MTAKAETSVTNKIPEPFYPVVPKKDRSVIYLPKFKRWVDRTALVEEGVTEKRDGWHYSTTVNGVFKSFGPFLNETKCRTEYVATADFEHRKNSRNQVDAKRQ